MTAGKVVYEKEIGGIYRLVFVELDDNTRRVMALPMEGYTPQQALEAFWRDMGALEACGLVQIGGDDSGEEE